jgi:hypothetical protein
MKTLFLSSTCFLLLSCTSYVDLPRCERPAFWLNDCEKQDDQRGADLASKSKPGAPGDPDDDPDDPPTEPPDEPDDPGGPPGLDREKKPNAGRGNGSEGDPDVDPGKSGEHNRGGD